MYNMGRTGTKTLSNPVPALTSWGSDTYLDMHKTLFHNKVRIMVCGMLKNSHFIMFLFFVGLMK